MTKPAPYRQADVTRLIRGALRAGLPVGSFKVSVENGQPVLLPISVPDPLPSAQDAEDAWDRALGLR